MSAETVRLLHLVLDKLDRLAGKGAEADWRAVWEAMQFNNNEVNTASNKYGYGMHTAALAIAERHMIKDIPPDQRMGANTRPSSGSDDKASEAGTAKVPSPAPDALGERAPSPVAGMETTAEFRRMIVRSPHRDAPINRLLRDHDRALAEIARLTAELAEVQDKCRAWEATCVDLTADWYEADSKLEQVHARTGIARSTGGET